ncbi:MAG: acetolactate synthase [Planctomycetes bacterium]|nr:acetolactate synthase [Planctomycetota bacterium]
MSQVPGSPVNFETEQGYGPPMCTQFSVFLDNRIGKMYELIETFDGQPLRLVALSVMDASDHSVVRLVTSRADRARELLENQQLPFTEAEILVVELGEDQRLTKLCLSLLGAELNIDYAYPLMVRPHGLPTIAIHCDDPVLAGQILARKGFCVVSEEELRDGSDHEPPLV